MNLGRLLEKLVERRRWLAGAMLVVMAGLVIADIVTPSKYNRFPWESIGGFGAVYGLFSCVVIVVVSKAIGYALLYRPEDYYDD